MGNPYCDSFILLLWVYTAAVSMWTQAPTLAWQAILTHYTIPQLGLVFQKLNRRKKIGCLHTIRKNTHMMQCMYERGRGADRLSTQHRESGAKGLDFSLSFVTDVPGRRHNISQYHFLCLSGEDNPSSHLQLWGHDIVRPLFTTVRNTVYYAWCLARWPVSN